MNAQEECLLRIAFLAGAMTDAGALLPMLFPQLANLLWGFRAISGNYLFDAWLDRIPFWACTPTLQICPPPARL